MTLSGKMMVAKDTHVREASAGNNFDRYAYFAASNPGGGAEIRTLLTPPRPTAVALAANKVLSAVLSLTQRGSWTTAHTLTIRLLTATFAEDTVTWTNKPGVRTGAGAMTAAITGQSDGYVHEIDLATLFENAANNGWGYYGIEISTNATSAALFYSENDTGGTVSRQATIEYEWAIEPSRPTSLHPAAARSETTPRFLAATAGVDVSSQRVQVASDSAFSTVIRDRTTSGLSQVAVDYDPSDEATIGISTVARASNVATVVTDTDHGFTTGDRVSINAQDNDFDATAVSVTVVDPTSFTYANTGGNQGATADTGDCTGFSALTSDATYYWRCLFTTPDGLTSPWSAIQSFSVKSKPTIDITSVVDPITNDITPTVSWTYSAGEGGAQRQYQVTIYEWDPLGAVYLSPSYNAKTGKWSGGWKSGAVLSAATSLVVPDGVLKTGRKYKLRLDIWDSVTRDDERSDRAFQTDSTEWLLNVDAATVGVTTFAVTQAPQYPAAAGMSGALPITKLAWTRGSVPERFRILHRLVNEATYRIVADGPPEDFAAEFGSGYEFYHVAPGGIASEYKVLAIVGVKPSQQTSLNPFFLLAGSNWTFGTTSPAAATLAGADDGAALGGKIVSVNITSAGDSSDDVVLRQTLPTSANPQTYTVKARLRSREGTKSVKALIRKYAAAYTEYGSETFDIGSDWVEKTWSWTVTAAVAAEIRLEMGTGASDVDIDYFYAEINGIEAITPSIRGAWLIPESNHELAVPLVLNSENSSEVDEARVEIHPLRGPFVVISNEGAARRISRSAIFDENEAEYRARLAEIRRRRLTCILVDTKGNRTPVQLGPQSESAKNISGYRIYQVDLELFEVAE